jgi:hypothetical protein
MKVAGENCFKKFFQLRANFEVAKCQGAQDRWKPTGVADLKLKRLKTCISAKYN